MKKYLFLLLLNCSLFAGSLTLFNDSPFKLKGVILSATGANLGEIVLSPQHRVVWSDNQTSSNVGYSETPYSVIWYCLEGQEYGIWTNVSVGSFVTASGSEGPRICPTPKSQNQGTFQPQN
ncbi:MAG: hypothetical protein KDK44_06340 [Chlamydiia bacterium]|nr:hypothetical protein [Chlamydiia bacterium]MCP5509424.1 hypothetical protein [Chlamydiales bacterium]HPE84990.1 hypothetical protein [Chlamydiales bacterium]